LCLVGGVRDIGEVESGSLSPRMRRDSKTLPTTALNDWFDMA
jgi:hypothetical protein